MHRREVEPPLWCGFPWSETCGSCQHLCPLLLKQWAGFILTLLVLVFPCLFIWGSPCDDKNESLTTMQVIFQTIFCCLKYIVKNLKIAFQAFPLICIPVNLNHFKLNLYVLLIKNHTMYIALQNFLFNTISRLSFQPVHIDLTHSF